MKDSSFWEVTVPRGMTIYANAIFLLLWLGFIIALLLNRAWLDLIWNWVQALPLVPKIIVWVMLLPIIVGLWIWESSWTSLGQLLGFTGIVAWTFLAVSSFFRVFR